VTDGELTAYANLTVLVRFRPVISAELGDLQVRVGGQLRVDLGLFVSDQNDPRSALTWTVSVASGRHLSAAVDHDGSTLKVLPLRPGVQNLTLTVRNRWNGSDTRTISVTVLGSPPGAYDWARWPVTAGAFAAVAVILFLSLRGRFARAQAPSERRAGPAKATGGERQMGRSRAKKK
jgi:hypothetical protein